METIYGYLERISFYNEETNFLVAKIQEKGKKELTTIVGNLSGVNPGELLRVSGKWVHNNKFGDQFQVDKFESVVPATVNGIEKYLGSGLIKGIGPVMAKRIVRVFGINTLDVIENTYEELSRVEGIGPKRISIIIKAWQEQKKVKEIMIFLQGYGISANYSARIYKKYGDSSIETVKKNPYRLAADIQGIGFVTADKIARNMGIDHNAVIRAEEGIIYVLNLLVQEGHVYCPDNFLIKKSAEMLEVDKEIIVQAMAKLCEGRRLVLDSLEPSVELNEQSNQKAVYLPPLYTAETGLASRILSLKTGGSAIRPIDPEGVISWIEKVLNVQLADKQKEAIILSAASKVTMITGGPGTGKTTIIKAIVSVFRALKLRILLAAPTGRAAKRMREATGYEAKTIHRLMEYSQQKMGFQKNQDNPLETDVLIVDEASMIDTLLMYHLVKAIPSHAVFIMVGDINQLPSVGPGTVFADMISSDRFNVITLTEIFRQAKESQIVVNAHMINQGEFPLIRKPPEGKYSDFYFIQEDDPEEALNKIVSLCKEHIPKHFGYHPLKDVQVLTPMHRGVVGVGTLNIRLQEVLNTNRSKIVKGYKTFKINDKVMQMVNNYDKEVYNGDIGQVVAINQEDHELIVDYDGKKIVYSYYDLDELVLAYAISIHKSQGSEYKAVVMPVMMQHYMLLQRNLIYTGITRGKNLVVLIGSKKALAMAVRNNKPQNRFTRLRERLLTVT